MNERELMKTAADEAFAVKAADLSAADIVSGSVSRSAEVKGRFRYAAAAVFAAAAVAVGTVIVLNRSSSPRKDEAAAAPDSAAAVSTTTVSRAEGSIVSDQDKNTDSSPDEGSAAPSTEPSPMPENDALGIALKDAGLTEADISETRISKGTEDGHAVYEFDILAKDGAEYEYDVDMYSGEIIGRDYEAPKPTPADDSSTAEVTPSESKPSAPVITDDDDDDFDDDDDKDDIDDDDDDIDDDDDDDKAAALNWNIDEKAAEEAAKMFIGAPGSKLVLIERDCDDYGRPLYEIKLIENGIEYECDVDASTGEVLEAESEPAEKTAAQSDDEDEDEDDEDEDEEDEDEDED